MYAVYVIYNPVMFLLCDYQTTASRVELWKRLTLALQQHVLEPIIIGGLILTGQRLQANCFTKLRCFLYCIQKQIYWSWVLKIY